jgi:hypothetical protein
MIQGATGYSYPWVGYADESGSYFYHSGKLKMFYNYSSPIDVLQTDVRFTMKNTDPVSSVVAFVESDNTATITGAVSANGTGNESYSGTVTNAVISPSENLTTIVASGLSKGNAAVRVTMSRANTTLDPVLSKVTGAIE